MSSTKKLKKLKNSNCSWLILKGIKGRNKREWFFTSSQRLREKRELKQNIY